MLKTNKFMKVYLQIIKEDIDGVIDYSAFKKVYKNNTYTMYLITSDMWDDFNKSFSNIPWCVTKNKRIFDCNIQYKPDNNNGYILWINNLNNEPFALLHVGCCGFRNTFDEPIEDKSSDILDGLYHFVDVKKYNEGDLAFYSEIKKCSGLDYKNLKHEQITEDATVKPHTRGLTIQQSYDALSKLPGDCEIKLSWSGYSDGGNLPIDVCTEHVDISKWRMDKEDDQNYFKDSYNNSEYRVCIKMGNWDDFESYYDDEEGFDSSKSNSYYGELKGYTPITVSRILKEISKIPQNKRHGFFVGYWEENGNTHYLIDKVRNDGTFILNGEEGI